MWFKLLLCLLWVTTPAFSFDRLSCYLCVHNEVDGVLDQSCLSGTNMTTTTDFFKEEDITLPVNASMTLSDLHNAAGKVARMENIKTQKIPDGIYYCVSAGATYKSTSKIVFVRLTLFTTTTVYGTQCLEYTTNEGFAQFCTCETNNCNNKPYSGSSGSGNGRGDSGSGSTSGVEAFTTDSTSLVVGMSFVAVLTLRTARR